MKTVWVSLFAAGLLFFAAVPAPAQAPASPLGQMVQRRAERSAIDRLLRHEAELQLSREQTASLRAIEKEVKGTNRAVAKAYKEKGRPQGPGPRRDGQELREAMRQIQENDRQAAERAWALLTPEQRQRVRLLDRGGQSAPPPPPGG